jgi:hypothetical protein
MGKDADGVPCQGGCVARKQGTLVSCLERPVGRSFGLIFFCDARCPLTRAAIRNPNEAVYVTQGGVTCQAILSNAVEMPLIERRPGWGELKAVQRQRIFVADGNQYFNRPGPRIVESLEILAEIFHPEFFPSRYEGRGWIRYPAKPRANEQSRGSQSTRGN